MNSMKQQADTFPRFDNWRPITKQSAKHHKVHYALGEESIG